jgi:hypothetical protein
MQLSVVMCHDIHIDIYIYIILYRLHVKVLKDKLLKYDNELLVI